MPTSLPYTGGRINLFPLFSKLSFIVLFSLFTVVAESQTITVTSLSPASPYCQGASVTVNYSITAAPGNGNKYTAELSNSAGSFTSPINIGTLSSTATTGAIPATIPAAQAAGTGYQIRVTASKSTAATSTPTANLTINALPTITGTLTVCVGKTTQLTGSATAAASNPWVSSNGAIATISSNGLVTGVAAGTSTITYTNSNGCTKTATVTVNALPAVAAITGTTTVCAGNTTTLANATAGGSWSSSNTSAATVNSSTGVVTGVAAGTTTITYTTAANASGCTNTSTASVTVVPLPTAYNVTGGGAYCSGGAGVPVGLSGSQSGVNYQLQRSGTNSGNPVAGTGGALRFANQTTAGSYTVIATNAALSTCLTTMTGSATITVSATGAPTGYNLTGGGPYCVGGTAPNVVLSGSQSGVRYSLYRIDENDVSHFVNDELGTGKAINFGPKPLAGTYRAIARNETIGCTANMPGNPTVTINPLPTAFTVSGGGTASCITGVEVGLSGSQAGVNYQLLRDGSPVFTEPSIPGTGAALSFGNQIVSGTYTVRARNLNTSCITAMAGSASVTTTDIIVSPVHVSACGQGSDAEITIDVAGNGSYVYSKDNGATFQNTNTFTGLAEGTYQMQVQDPNDVSCSATFSIDVKKYNPVIASLYYKTATSCNANDAQIVIAARNGPLPYTYTINGGPNAGTPQPSNTFKGLGAGTYSVVVTDATGCIATVSDITIVQATPPTASLYYKSTTSCKGNDAQIVITATKGKPPYTYTLNAGTPQASNTFTGLAKGTYSVTVTDARGCTATVAGIQIVEAPLQALVYGKTNVTCLNGTDGSITVTRTGGVPPFQYSLSGTQARAFQTSNIFTNLPAGTYTITVKDSKGCTNTNGPVEVVINNGTGTCSGGSTSITASKPGNTIKSTFKVHATPNPSSSEFTLNVQSRSTEKVHIAVTDMLGKKVYQTTGGGNHRYTFGKHFISGVYIVQVMQGRQIQTIKLIKGN